MDGLRWVLRGASRRKRVVGDLQQLGLEAWVFDTSTIRHLQ